MVLSHIAADHVARPRNAGPLPNATHIGVSGTPGDGPYIKLFLLVRDGVVEATGYQCNGCPSSTAAASMAAQLAKGRCVSALCRIEARDILLVLGGLPDGKEYYGEMAAQALMNCVERRNQ